MKAGLHKILSVIFITFFAIPLLFGQKGIEDGSKFGHNEDSVNCRKNLSLYKTYYDQENYAMSLGFWRKTFYECPRSSKNLHLHGIRMFKILYGQTKDRAYIDSMMMVHDARIKYFGDEANYLGRKALDLWDIGSGDPELLKLCYSTIATSVNIDPANADAQILTIYMAATQKLFSDNVIDNNEVINNYGLIMGVLDQRIEALSRRTDITAKDNIDAIFKASGAATCEGLIPLFTDQIAEKPDDVELLKKVINLLEDAGCSDSDLYYTSAENLYKHEKSAIAAYFLAEMNYDKMEYDNAEHYYLESISLEEDNEKKSSYYTKLSTLRLSKKDYKVARDYAKKAIQFDASNATAYMLIGNVYSSIKIGEDDFENQTVYWVAADYFRKAKEINPELSSTINGYINTVSAMFPKKEEGFFRSITEEGISYSVGGWVNETTTVRWRKE